MKKLTLLFLALSWAGMAQVYQWIGTDPATCKAVYHSRHLACIRLSTGMDERKSYAMGGPTPYCTAWETPAPPVDPPGCTAQKILRANSTTKIKL